MPRLPARRLPSFVPFPSPRCWSSYCPGWVVGTTAAYSQIGAQLNALFGPSVAKVLLAAIQNSQHAQGVVATVMSIVSLLIGATTVLAALQSLLQQIWKSEAIASVGIGGWIRTRFLSLGFILALGFLLLVSLTLSTGLSNLQKHIGEGSAAVLGMLGAIDVLVSVTVVAILFTLIFRYYPRSACLGKWWRQAAC